MPQPFPEPHWGKERISTLFQPAYALASSRVGSRFVRLLVPLDRRVMRATRCKYRTVVWSGFLNAAAGGAVGGVCLGRTVIAQHITKAADLAEAAEAAKRETRELSGLLAGKSDGQALVATPVAPSPLTWPKAEDRTRNVAAQMLTEALTADQVRTKSR